MFSKRPEQIQILTMAPQSWTIKEIMEELGISERIVKTARKLKTENGILAFPRTKFGKKLSESVKERVMEFFQAKEFSRICPGKKDFISVRIDGRKVQMQKYLLLSNLKEMFTVYLSRNGPQIGFSKFCELKQKWCVAVDAVGSHYQEVYKMYQNVKLMRQS